MVSTLNILFGTAGYALTTLGFVFLFLLLLTTRQNSLQRTILLMSALFSSVWAISSALQIWYHYSMMQHLATETIRNFGWFLLLINALTNKQHIWAIVTLNRTVKIIMSLLLLFIILELAYPWLIWLTDDHIIMFHLAQSVTGLWLIEQLFRRTHKSSKWTIKPLCLGLGMIYAYDFALYADGLLTVNIDSGFLYGRGWITLLSLPFILLTARHVKHWSTRVYVSRDVVFHGTLLIVAGCYLLIMAIAGYYIKYAGGAWGSMVQNIFFALSGLILASLFLSESLRRNLKVFINKHFYANKYEYREEWIRFASVLEEDMKSPYSVALKAIIRPFDCEQGMLVTLDNGKLKKQAHVNLTHENDHFAPEDALQELIDYAIKHRWIVDINELKHGNAKTPFQFNTDAISNIKIFRYIVPIVSNTGIKGACLISEPKSTQSLNWEDRDLMRAISNQLSVYLNLYRTNQTLTENQQFDTFNRMSAFLAHDLKNILAQLQLLSKNGKRHKQNPEFIEDAFETIDSAVSRLSKVVNHLRKNNVEPSTEQRFKIDSVIEQICQLRTMSKPEPKLKLAGTNASIIADKERFGNVVSHIIQNAQEATTSEGFVKVTTSTHNGYYVISIEDDGIGMSDDFIENRLFKPFDTTKGNSGMGIGAYDAKKMFEEMGGHIDVFSASDKGSRFIMSIPVK